MSRRSIAPPSDNGSYDVLSWPLETAVGRWPAHASRIWPGARVSGVQPDPSEVTRSAKFPCD